MRRYCRNVDITDIKFIVRCIYLWIDGKKSRRDVQHFLSVYSGLPYAEIREAAACEDYWFLPETVNRIAQDARKRLLARELDLPPIRFMDKYDDVCMKWRVIGIQKPIHQIFDYIAVEACREMFDAKIGPYQMASMKGRGQEKGAKAIQKWMQLDEAHTRYYVQGDVRHCYPSISHDILKAMFTRDIKNPQVVWLAHELIDAFPEGLSIGSYFSQYACNYYMSKAYHFAGEQLAKTRKKRNGKEERTRLVYHILFYMDDILFLGSSKKDVEKGMELFSQYARDELELEIKSDWKSGTVDYIGRDGKRRGAHIDMMGYRIYRDHITVRRRTFKRIRRTILRAESRLESGMDMTLEMARRVISHAGKLQNSDSYEFCKRHNVSRIRTKAEQTVSTYAKCLAEEKKRRKEAYANHDHTLPGSPGGDFLQPDFGWDFGGMAPEEYTAGDCPF